MKYVKPLRLFTDLLTTTTEPQRLLCLDVGKVVVGLAVSDEQNKLALPLNLVVYKNEFTEEHHPMIATDFQRLADSRSSIHGFVVADPLDRLLLNPDGIHTKVFMGKLAEAEMFEGMKYTYWNKRFSTTSMEASAVSTLQDYLDCMNEKHEAELN